MHVAILVPTRNPLQFYPQNRGHSLIRPALIVASIVATFALETPVQAEVFAWQFWSRPDGEGNLSNCRATDSYTEPCVNLSCGPDGTIFLRAFTDAVHRPQRSPATLLLNGTPTMTAIFSLVVLDGSQDRYETPIPNGTAIGLLDRLARADTLSFKLEITALNRPELAAISLSTLAAPLASFRQHCNLMNEAQAGTETPKAALQMTGSEPSIIERGDPDPASDKKRFVDIEAISLSDDVTVALGRRLLAGRIAEVEADVGEPIKVLTNLIPFDDGRALMFVFLCHATYFGITGCYTYTFYTPPGGTDLVFLNERIGGGPYWLDLQSSKEGWPDLISMPRTAKGAFVRSNFWYLEN